MAAILQFIQKITSKKPYWVLAGLLLVLAAFFDYPSLIQNQPRSSHTWRQSDAAAIAANYYRSDLKFFKPRVYNRHQADGFMLGEFTGTYYLAAIAYKVLGVQPWILRFIHATFFFFGLLALYKITLFFTSEKWLAYWMSLLFAGAPILTYYGMTALPDVPAFSCILMGLAGICYYAESGKMKWWWLACAAFLLGGLLKVTMLMPLGGLMAMYVMKELGWLKLKLVRFPSISKTVLGFGAIFSVVFICYFLIIKFNQHHHTDYFLVSTFPIWSVENMDSFTYVFFRTFFLWSAYYFFPLTLVVLFLLAAIVFFGRQKPLVFLHGMSLFTFLGCGFIYVLWYYQFIDHDYYLITMYIFPIFLLLSGMDILKTHFNHIFTSTSLKVILYLFLLLNLGYAKHTMGHRYGGYLDYVVNPNLGTEKFHQYLNDHNITKDAMVLSLPDPSPNITLNLLNRPGFTEWQGRKRIPMTEAQVRSWIQRGARYLIINDLNYLNQPYLQPFLKDEVGSYKDIKIYHLSHNL